MGSDPVGLFLGASFSDMSDAMVYSVLISSSTSM